MYGDVWEVLGIEPTSNKKIIQQAYAEKIKLYHPEEYPGEFQHLQEAYRVASRYARRYKENSYSEEPRKKVVYQLVEDSVAEKPIWIPKDAEEKEPIPDYIIELGETDARTFYERDIVKYVNILVKKLTDYAGERDKKELASLFDDNRFCTVLSMKEFQIHMENEMAHHRKWNQEVLNFLLEKIQKMMNENTNHHLADLKYYLKSKVEKTNFVHLLVLMFVFVSLAWLMYLPTDTYMLKHSPQKEDICQLVQEQYGLLVEPDDVSISVLRSYFNIIDEEDIIKYTIRYEKDGRVHYFSGVYEWGEDMGVVFDLENESLRE